MAELSEGDKKQLGNIEMYGWHVLKVLEDETGPGFTYTVGLYHTFKHPEIVIIGLNPDLSHDLLSGMVEEIRNEKPFSSGHFYSDIIEGFDCYFTTVEKVHYDEYFGRAQWFYKNDDFPVLQCIYPTTKGIYPWEREWPGSIKDLQPLLGPSPVRKK